MASVTYGHCVNDALRGTIDFDTDTFYAMLVTSAYVPNVDTHHYRSDVTNEVGNSGNYSSGGAVTTATVTKQDASNQIEVAFSSVNFTSATITARAAVIYKYRGGAATADELVAYVDFLSDISSTNGTFTATFSSPLTFAY